MEDQIASPDQPALADQLGVYANYEIASMGQRFVNYLVDNILMQYGLSYLTGTIVGYFIAGYFPDYAYKLAYNPSFVDNIIIGYPIVILNYFCYYTFCEKLFKGYTLGKLISGTRAIRIDGAELTLKDAVLRSLSRLVPFEAFSALVINHGMTAGLTQL